MQVKVVSDGTAHGTEIVNAETGEKIDNVQSIEFKAVAGQREPVVVTLTLLARPIFTVEAPAILIGTPSLVGGMELVVPPTREARRE